MLYYTQLIYIKKGKEDLFHTFEDHVLPLLVKYNGKLLYRVRPASESIVATEVGEPYEVHLVSFPSKADFAAYAGDKERQGYLHLKDSSVARVLLVEGTEL